MERCDFASIMKIIRNDILDGSFANQNELLETLFSSYLQSNNTYFDMGLLNKWLNGLSRVSPAIGLFYLKNKKNRDELAVTMEDVMLPCLSDSAMTVQKVFNLFIQDPTISERKKQELSANGAFETNTAEASFLTDILIFGMTRPFQARDIRKPRALNDVVRSPEIRGYILDGEPPEPCEHFFGREEEIESIHNALNCYGKIFVEGLPGIGKSEVAKAYARAYKKEYTNILYIMYSGDLQRDIANLCFADDMPNEKEKNRLYRHDRFLRTLNEDTLLIIDNFDTKSAKEVSLFNLRKYHCHILITTRCRWSGYRRMRIGPVKDIESLFQMVAQFYPDAEENRETVLKIIEEVQWNTLMVELIGRLLGQGLNRPDDVLTKLYYLGTLVSGDEKVRISKDGKIRRDTVTAHIQALMALSELTAGQKEIMRCMVLIPPTGISELLLVRWMNLDNANEIEELIERGYLTQLKDNKVMMPRSIQKACLAELMPTPGKCKTFLDSIRIDCTEHYRASSYYALIIKIIEALLDGSIDEKEYLLQFLQDLVPYVEKYDRQDVLDEMASHIMILAYRHGGLKADYPRFSYYQAKSDPDPTRRISTLNSALSMLDLSQGENAQLARMIYQAIGEAYLELGDQDSARKSFAAALFILKEYKPPKWRDFFMDALSTVDLFKHVGAIPQALGAVQIPERSIEETNPDSFDHGLVLQLKGELLLMAGETDSAIEALLRAYHIFKDTLSDNHNLFSKKERQIKELLAKTGIQDIVDQNDP